MANNQTLKSVIKTKLENLKDENENSYLKAVYDYDENNPSGYPFAIVAQELSEGRILDTVYTERIWQINIKIFQEISEEGKSKKEALDLLTIVQDKIIEMFDKDPQLEINGTPNCERVEIVSDSKHYDTNESPLIYIEIIARCRDLVNRHN